MLVAYIVVLKLCTVAQTSTAEDLQQNRSESLQTHTSSLSYEISTLENQTNFPKNRHLIFTTETIYETKTLRNECFKSVYSIYIPFALKLRPNHLRTSCPRVCPREQVGRAAPSSHVEINNGQELQRT